MMRRLFLPALWAFPMVFAACDLMSTRVAEGGGSEATNGNLVGAALYPDGSRAAWTSALLRPAGWLRDTAKWERETVPDALSDAKGYWHLDSLDTGAYRLELRDGKGRAFAAEVDIHAGKAQIRFDTLDRTGKVTGMLSSMAGRSAPAFVAAYGLDHIIRTDASGRFTLSGLPRGRHRLHAVAGVAGWGWPDQEVVLEPGRDSIDLGIVPPTAFVEEDYSRWEHTRRLRVDLSSLGLSGTLRDFPLMIRLDQSTFDFRQSNGTDLRVSGPGGRHLDCELDYWDAKSGNASLWVRMDSLDLSGPDPILALYWGKPDAADLSDGRRVFRAHDGTWHLSGLPGSGLSAFADASTLGLNASGDALAFDSAVSGPGAAFSGGLHVTVPETAILKPATSLGYSVWMRSRSSDSTGGELGSMGDNYGLRMLPDGNLYFFAFNDPAWSQGAPVYSSRYQILQTTDRNIMDDRWHHVAAVLEGDSLRLYCDGKVAAKAPLRAPIRYPFRNDFEIGRHGFRTHDKDFQGGLDEARFSHKGWSAAWLRVEYENQKPGSGLVRFE